MINSKLYQMLVGLNKKEWNKLEDLVRSPYFNKQEKCIELFNLLKEAILSQNLQHLEKSFIIKQLFKTTKNADNYLRVIMSYLTQLVEEFFIQEKLKDQDYYKKHLLNNAFLDKELFGHYNSSAKKHEKISDPSQASSSLRKGKESYFDTYLQTLDESKYHLITKERNTDVQILESQIEALHQYYWINRLAINLELLSLKNISQESLNDANAPLWNELSGVFAKDEHKLLSIYHSAVLMLHYPEEKSHYTQLEQQLEEHHPCISKRELNHLYTLLINHLIQKNHRGENQFQKVFHLYQFMADHHILIEEEYITLSKFKNIVTLGCLLKQFDWVLHFIETYKLTLAPQHRESVYAFNMGFLYFFKKEFHFAQEYLLTVDHFDVFYTMDTKSLLIQIYYETKQLQAVQYMLDPFRDFLRKQKKLNKNIKIGYLNFIKMLSLILKAQQKYGHQPIEQGKLLVKLDSYNVVHRKEWLREKILILNNAAQFTHL